LPDEALRGRDVEPGHFLQRPSAIADYDSAIRRLALQGDTDEILHRPGRADVQHACDLFRPLTTAKTRSDGYVSLEVSPLLVNDTEGTVEEGPAAVGDGGPPQRHD
jgi:transaldolase/glucose-6-phosphate isomerase